MEHMEKRKRNSETSGAAAQGGTPAGYRNLGDKAGCREHAAETGHRERGDKAVTAPCEPAEVQGGTDAVWNAAQWRRTAHGRW